MAYRGLRGTLVVAAAVGAAFAGQAGAAGFALIEQNASGLGNAYSGAAATAEDASTIWFNPAGMTRLAGRQAVGALTAVKPSTDFSINSSQPCTQTSAVSAGALPPLITTGCTNSGGDAGDWGFPLSAYLSWQLTPEVWLGLGISAPFGLKTEWDSGWVGRFHAIKSDLMTVNINPSVAWKINEMFSVGGGVSAMYIDAELTNSVDYSAIAAAGGAAGFINAASCPNSGPGPTNCEGVATVKADSWAWGWNIGGMINFSPNTRVGLTYRSTLNQKLEGDVSFANRPAFLNAALPNTGVNATVKLPRYVLDRSRALDGSLAVPRRLHVDRLGFDPESVDLPVRVDELLPDQHRAELQGQLAGGVGSQLPAQPGVEAARRYRVRYDARSGPVSDAPAARRRIARGSRSVRNGHSPSRPRSTSGMRTSS